MARRVVPNFAVLRPDLQVSFAARLREADAMVLQPSLARCIRRIGVDRLNAELHRFAMPDDLARLASFGVRGEMWFATPSVLNHSPALLGYYRLLLGLSQKEFYSKGPFGRFKALEESGTVSDRVEPFIAPLCNSLARSSSILLAGLAGVELATIRDLQLLTLGAQYRGSNNNRIGQRASIEVLDLIRGIVQQSIVSDTPDSITLRNASRRLVRVMVSADPDISVIEETVSGEQPKLSIEIKGGADESNKHNRLGEAEKSHIKARERGFIEFWTLVRVALAADEQRRGSPTTNHYFHIDRIADSRSKEHARFRDQLCSVLGIRAKRSRPQRRDKS